MTHEHLQILLIEDNPADARLVREMFAAVEEIDIDMDWVSRLSIGLDRCARGGIDLVLLDLTLPDSQGIDTLRTVRSQLPHAPIVVLTGIDQGPSPFVALREGAQDYLVKCQLDSASLIRSVRYAVERKRIEEELEIRTTILSTQFELCPDGILVVDERRRIIHFNRRFMDLWKIPIEVMEAGSDKRAQRMILSNLSDPQGFCARLTRLYGDHHAASNEQLVLKDGRTFECHSAPMLGPNERCCGRIWFFRDITERKRAETAMQTLSQRQEAILSAVPEVIMEVDARKVYTWANPAGRAFFGEDVIGKEAAFYSDGEQEVCPAVQPIFSDNGNAVYVESWQRRKDGEKRLLAWWCRVLKDEKGHVTGALSTGRDITERKRAEAERATLEDQLRQAQKMESIGRLAGGIAHDFNNILTGIGGYTELAVGQLDAASPLREDLAEVQRLVKRAADLTRQLLAFSRRQPLTMQVLNLNDTVADTDKMLKRVLGEDIDFHFAPAPDLGNVRADPGQMEQILMNLAVNSRDAMPAGGRLTIETANIELDADYAGCHVAVAPGPYVMLAVSDTGHGMDAATRERLFEPFFTTKEKGKGTGLGLATVHGIVKQHDGNIWVYSEPGQGATFKIYLPRVAEAVTGAKAPATQKTVGGKETILIVEDEASVRVIVERTLKAQGYAILTAGSAEDAERAFSEQPEKIALLLTDVVLPGVNGRNLYDLLKSKNPNLKVLYMSGYTDDAIAHNGVLNAGVAFMQKPFTIETVARKVRQVLDG